MNTRQQVEIRIKRVLGVRSADPAVLAHVDGHMVRWRPNRGWRCECGQDDCVHIRVMQSVLAPEVTEERNTQ